MFIELMGPALGADGQHGFHQWWWMLLALCVFALVSPLAYALGKGVVTGDGEPLRRPRRWLLRH